MNTASSLVRNESAPTRSSGTSGRLIASADYGSASGNDGVTISLIRARAFSRSRICFDGFGAYTRH
jgi:hypothetical protein